MVETMRIIMLSFFASIGFGIVFQIRGRNLVLAGIGGALTRAVYLLLMQVTDSRIVYITLAALFASCYGELLAVRAKVPSTYYIYPSIIPLIPGDLFYFALLGLIRGDMEALSANGMKCALSLVGMSIGFVLSTTVVHYIRVTLMK